MKRLFLTALLCFGITFNVYGASTKLEDESGVGAILNKDAAHVSGQPGIMELTVRKDTAAALGGTDADYQPLITDANGRLHVIEPSASGGLTALQLIDDIVYADDADWTNSTSKHALIGGIYESTPQTITDGDTGPIELDANGKIIESNSAAIKTALEIIDDWDSSDNAKVKINSRATSSSTAIDAQLLDDDPILITSNAVTISEYQRVGLFWTYDETQVGNSVSGTLTVEVSPDGTNYFSAPFFDTAGGATPQTSEVLSADGSYICWLDSNIPFAYMKVTVTGTNTDADDTILTSVYVYMDK